MASERDAGDDALPHEEMPSWGSLAAEGALFLISIAATLVSAWWTYWTMWYLPAVPVAVLHVAVGGSPLAATIATMSGQRKVAVYIYVGMAVGACLLGRGAGVVTSAYFIVVPLVMVPLVSVGAFYEERKLARLPWWQR